MKLRITALVVLGIATAVAFANVQPASAKTTSYPDVETLPVGSIVKCPTDNRVYQVASNVQLNWFKNEAVYFAHGHNWGKIKLVSCESVTHYHVLINNYPVDRMVRFNDSYRVYMTSLQCPSGRGDDVCNDVLTHVLSSDAAMKLYGTQWGGRIVQLPTAYKSYFTFTNAKIVSQ